MKKRLNHLIEAYVDLKNWIINCTIQPDFINLFNKLHDEHKLFDFYENGYLQNDLKPQLDNKKNPFFKYPENLYIFLSGIAYHEFGHSKECPIDSDNFSKILQAVSTSLEQNNIFNEELTYYIINLFSDLVINTIYGLEKSNSFFRNSIFTFFFSEIIFFNSSDTIFNLFVLLNLKLLIYDIEFRNKMEDLIIKTLPKDFEKKIKELIRIFCSEKNIIENLWLSIEPNENDKWKIINKISNSNEWDSMAYEFTQILSDYISEDSSINKKTLEDSIFTKKMRKDQKFRKDILERIIENKLEKRKKLEKKDIKNFIERGKNGKKKGNSKSISEKYPGELSLDKGMKSFDEKEKLNAIYKYRLKKVEISFRETNNSDELPLVWLNRQPIKENSYVSNFDPLNIYFLPNSDELLLYEKKVPYTKNQDSLSDKKGFPDLAIFCDDSGSMDWKIETGDGKYDTLIISLLSLLEWLKDKGFASVIKYNFTFFSNTTRSTGWVDYFHLEEMKKLLFSHEGGQTILNPKKLKNILISKERIITIIISDGIIYNSEKVYNILKKNVNNEDFFFIQIGNESDLSKKLDKNGFNVKIIRDISKLSILILNFLKNSYNII